MINQRNRRVGFVQAFKEYIKGAFDFNGFSTREGVWKAFLGEFILYIVTWMGFTVAPIQLGIILTVFVGLGTFVCSLSTGVRRMHDICMSTKGIWIYYCVIFIAGFMFSQSHSTGVIRVFFLVAGLIVALLPTNSLLKYKDTAFGKWFVDPSLENIVETHNTQS